MEIPLGIQLTNIKVNIKPLDRKIKDIVGFFEIIITDDEDKPFFKVRGGTIKVKQFEATPSPVFTLNAPAYRSGFGYRASFIVESKALWSDITKAILEEFSQLNGGLTPEDYMGEEINIDEINL